MTHGDAVQEIQLHSPFGHAVTNCTALLDPGQGSLNEKIKEASNNSNSKPQINGLQN